MPTIPPVHKTVLLGSIGRWLSRRRFPTLLVLIAGLLAVDLIVPDPVPFADELLLMALTATLTLWRKQRTGGFIDDGRLDDRAT